MKFEHLPDLGVRELDAQRVARRRIQDRFRGCSTRLRPQRFDSRPRPRGLDAIADGLLERGHLGHRRVRLLGSYSDAEPVLAERGLELPAAPRIPSRVRGAPGTPPPSCAAARSHSWHCRDRPARPAGTPRRLRRDCPRGPRRHPALNAWLAAHAAGDDRQRQKNPEPLNRLVTVTSDQPAALQFRNPCDPIRSNQQSSINNQQF